MNTLIFKEFRLLNGSLVFSIAITLPSAADVTSFGLVFANLVGSRKNWTTKMVIIRNKITTKVGQKSMDKINDERVNPIKGQPSLARMGKFLSI